MKFVETELKAEICQKHIWLDSPYVLNRIQSERPVGTFVENRMAWPRMARTITTDMARVEDSFY